ncbi:unnamed protein product [Pleuronectes platessa]|uniref:Uncharacterized protein n=1 Tax=Pleuronectes platessa TaxID=8262 RepID=A0A9N7U388_PLEPL|nr:unnamed protein product [Pleuronectes platessa]
MLLLLGLTRVSQLLRVKPEGTDWKNRNPPSAARREGDTRPNPLRICCSFSDGGSGRDTYQDPRDSSINMTSESSSSSSYSSYYYHHNLLNITEEPPDARSASSTSVNNRAMETASFSFGTELSDKHLRQSAAGSGFLPRSPDPSAGETYS